MREPAVEAYFTALRDIRASGAGVAETSFYPALSELLNAIGGKLKPKVMAIINLRNTGGGIPDGGLFTAQQLKGWDPGTNPLAGQLPARGAIEVKGTKDDVFATATGEQVARYVDRYGLVLVINLRDFALVGRGPDGSGTRILETLQLAKTEAGFWAKVQQPRKYAEEAGEGLTEFLRRVFLHDAPLADPKDLAWFLASYARTARLRLEQRSELPELDALRGQLEDSLGLKFEGEKGEHFFRSTLVQTLFYGMFASWVLWSRGRDHAEQIPWDRRFQWETATVTLHVPMVYELFRQFADPRHLGALGISEVLEWAEEVLWRVDRQSFFEKFREEHAVQYFYEPFLEAFDPDLRKELGVWYTPEEVVKYMVARVDSALRHELGIADGLADPSVVVLDPCCGTGTYLVEVLRTIHRTLTAKGADALTRQDVKQAALSRVIGFEIMPAPFVVAHLQLGILLAELGLPLKDADERAAVYLTNALTGWNTGVTPPKERRGAVPGQLHSSLLFPEFAEERDAADRIKREEKILVIIGNPPYNGYAGVAQDEEADLIAPYKEGLSSEWGITKNYLDDLYIRFYRLAERRIAEEFGRGLVCLISNFSWLGDPSAVQMRRSILGSFRRVFIDNLNGDSRETGKRAPDGTPDPSVFSGPFNPAGIQVGTAIVTLTAGSDLPPRVAYRDFWSSDKRARLLDLSSSPELEDDVKPLSPEASRRYVLRPFVAVEGYEAWPSVLDLSATTPSLGLNENRGGALVDTEREALSNRMRHYLDASVEFASLGDGLEGLTRPWARFTPTETRRRLVDSGGFQPEHIAPFLAKPFDSEWAYAEPRFKLWNESRAHLVSQASLGSAFVLARARAPRAKDGAPFYVFSGLADQHALHKDAYLFPTELLGEADFAQSERAHEPNLSTSVLRYLDAMRLPSGTYRAQVIWMHVVAVGYSLDYQVENDDAIRSSWPRVPLPADADVLRQSSELGDSVARLLNPLQPFSGGVLLGTLSSTAGTLDPATDLAVTARWGIAGKGGITMPSIGRLVERPYTDDEIAAIREHAAPLGMSGEEALGLLGGSCLDVYLNDVAYCRAVPHAVWHYTIGGYQVIKKWLSYRERALLGRDLTPEEARYVTEMVRRIAALVLMQPELDANYERVKADVWEWGQ